MDVQFLTEAELDGSAQGLNAADCFNLYAEKGSGRSSLVMKPCPNGIESYVVPDPTQRVRVMDHITIGGGRQQVVMIGKEVGELSNGVFTSRITLPKVPRIFTSLNGEIIVGFEEVTSAANDLQYAAIIPVGSIWALSPQTFPAFTGTIGGSTFTDSTGPSTLTTHKGRVIGSQANLFRWSDLLDGKNIPGLAFYVNGETGVDFAVSIETDKTFRLLGGFKPMPLSYNEIMAIPAPDAGTKYVQNDAHTADVAFNAVLVKGGGNQFAPVFFDGTDWRFG